MVRDSYAAGVPVMSYVSNKERAVKVDFPVFGNSDDASGRIWFTRLLLRSYFEGLVEKFEGSLEVKESGVERVEWVEEVEREKERVELGLGGLSKDLKTEE